MNRRDFLSAAAAGAMASAANSATAAPPASGPARAPTDPLPPPPGGINYFTREQLEKSIDTSKSTGGIDFTVATYVCNLWHPTPTLEKWFGRGFSEWELLRRACPLFEGHHQPKRPLWGTYPEDHVEYATRELDLAAASGIDVFMVDWYWHSGEMFLHEALERGYMKSPSWPKVKFALMWANHDWPNFYPAPEQGQEAILLPQEYSEADFDHMTDYLVEHYFRQPNYWRLDGKPVFAIFSPDHLIARLGGVEQLRKALDCMRGRVVKAGLPGIHFQASDQYVPGRTPIEAAGFESATRYHMFAFGGQTNRTPYAEGVEFGIRMWHEHAKAIKVPYFPDCPVGWDNSPRYGRRAHVFENRTPDQFERMIEAAKHFLVNHGTRPPVIFLSAWNEWTEDHYLLPDETHGYAYLEAVRRQFRA